MAQYNYQRVVVIDDTYMDRYIAERVIKKHMFSKEVLGIESAKEAIDYLISCNDDLEMLPQLIFLDINMPEMTGFEFLERYHDLSEAVKENCTIIMLTTSLNEDDKNRAAQNQYVQMFINKPLTIEKLMQIA